MTQTQSDKQNYGAFSADAREGKAAKQGESINTDAWINANATEGSTASEKYLVQLAKRAFLSLWSYSNVYTDEGRQGRGNGKEFCDLLVVFGDDVILFSDKHCEFIPHPDVNVAWGRWYRRAIEKSAKQLSGAEAWLTRFPDRLFLDPGCKTRLPIKLPDPSRRRVHLIAVTRGAAEYAESYWGGGSSGSYILDTSLDLSDHKQSPFHVGWVLPNRRFVHVFDETSLDILLRELDTASDFVTYLRKKQERLETPSTDFLILGEEELVATYLLRFDPRSQEHHLPEAVPDALVVVGEGYWASLLTSKAYKSWKRENEISYLWDELIEYQNKHIIEGSASILYADDSIELHERSMRMMAQESRVSRRLLGESIYRARKINKEGKRYTRTIVGGPEKDRAYVIMSLPQPGDCGYEQYREFRRDQLTEYCYGCKVKFKHVREVVGIAFEPNKASTISVDFIVMNCGDTILDPDFEKEIQEQLVKDNMWIPENVKYHVVRNMPFLVRDSKLITTWRKLASHLRRFINM